MSVRSLPRLLFLENRLTPNTYIVTSTAPTGGGSLADAIGLSNANPGADTIDFSATFNTPQNIALASALNITGDLRINGKGSALTTVSAAMSSRIFNWSSALTVSINGLTLTGGQVGGIEGTGGAINATGGGNLLMTDVAVNQNYGGSGGALFFNAVATSAAAAGNSMTLANCDFANNHGSAVYVANYAESIIVVDCVFNLNKGQSGGAMRFDRDPVTLTIDSSTFSGNSAIVASGGALYMGKTGTGGTATISKSTFSGNSAGFSGGAIFTGVGTLRLVNSTISGNTASLHMGGGGGIAIQGGTLNLFNTTIAFNVAESTGVGGGIRVTNSPNVTLESTVVSGNSSTSENGPDISGMVTIATNLQSLISNTSGTSFSNANLPITGSALLDPLANYGGPNETHRLQAGSPAIDKGNNNLSPALSDDQRGPPFARQSGAGVDIGSFEVQVVVAPTATVKIDDGADQRSMIQSLTITFNEPVQFTGSAAAAITLRRLASSTNPVPNGLVSLSFSPSTGPATAFTITFNDPTFAPVNGLAKSLIDGKYELVLDATQIQSVASGQFFDGDGNGTGGDSQTTSFRRQFGDVNGDGFTDITDLLVFRAANGSNNAQGNFNPAFDSNGDGFIDNVDFVAFRKRLGMTP